MAKTLRPQPSANKGKGKAVAKAAYKGKNEESDVVYDYDEGSVHDVALRAQVLRGYEEFKVRIVCLCFRLCAGPNGSLLTSTFFLCFLIDNL